jgi:hypothetical protein
VFRGHGSFEQQEEREIAIVKAILSPRSLALARLRMTTKACRSLRLCVKNGVP